ncbi:restriction endonuclease subunit S [Bradyrhizobium stylosanthis]|uniref:restriction endonuclease subunit S n=1 Tax=Bradyrhizobium stylosanthis TaxID=1803665 RepID=UPI0007C4A0B4|nr:restriction endonuclease subunit S [Bradyrhizobium stylosanthis]
MSFARYDSYRASGADWLGNIPEHWSAARIKALFEIRKRIAGELGHDVLSVTQHGLKVRDIDSNDGQLSMDYSKYQLVEPDDFVMNHMDLLTGYVDLSTGHGVTSPDYRVFAARTKDLALKYFLYLFQNGYEQRIFYAFGQGASGLGRWRMPTDSFNDFILPVPPLSEQTGIAKFLDRETAKIDALVEEQQRLIHLLQEKRQAVISHATTKGLDPNVPMKRSGLQWLDDVPAHWGLPQKLNDLAEPRQHSFVNGPFGSDLLTSELTSEGVPVIYIRDLKQLGYCRVSEWCVTDEKAKQLSFCRVIPGDILIAKVGDPPGLAAIYPPGEAEAIVTQDVIRLRVRSTVDANFLVYLLNSDFGGEQINSISVDSTRTRVGLGQYKQLKFVLPPLREQHAIRAFLDSEIKKVDCLVGEAVKAVALLQERRLTLISAAVTGKIDVRTLVEASAPVHDMVAA